MRLVPSLASLTEGKIYLVVDARMSSAPSIELRDFPLSEMFRLRGGKRDFLPEAEAEG